VTLPDPSVAHDLAEAVRMIQEEFARPLRMEELAAKAGLSAYQLGRRIQALYGLTPAKLIAKTRIDAACQMLAEEGRSISEIAQACGYGDQSAFTRQFKSVVGLTPARYRERRIRGVVDRR
jgi:AraC-like DNA-binding protein